MEKYKIKFKGKKVYVGTMLTATNLETGEVIKFSKNSIAKGNTVECDLELCEALFQVDDLFYRYFPMEYRTDEMTGKMIKKYYSKYYEYYPIKFRNYDLFLEYARFTGSNLSSVPGEQIIQEMCDLFIMANPGKLCQIPKDFIKDWYYDSFIRKNYHLGFVPVQYRTLNVCKRFVYVNRQNIEYVPDDILLEMCIYFGIVYSKELNLGYDNSCIKKKIIKKD